MAATPTELTPEQVAAGWTEQAIADVAETRVWAVPPGGQPGQGGASLLRREPNESGGSGGGDGGQVQAAGGSNGAGSLNVPGADYAQVLVNQINAAWQAAQSQSKLTGIVQEPVFDAATGRFTFQPLVGADGQPITTTDARYTEAQIAQIQAQSALAQMVAAGRIQDPETGQWVDTPAALAQRAQIALTNAQANDIGVQQQLAVAKLASNPRNYIEASFAGARGGLGGYPAANQIGTTGTVGTSGQIGTQGAVGTTGTVGSSLFQTAGTPQGTDVLPLLGGAPLTAAQANDPSAIAALEANIANGSVVPTAAGWEWLRTAGAAAAHAYNELRTVAPAIHPETAAPGGAAGQVPGLYGNAAAVPAPPAAAGPTVPTSGVLPGDREAAAGLAPVAYTPVVPLALEAQSPQWQATFRQQLGDLAAPYYQAVQTWNTLTAQGQGQSPNALAARQEIDRLEGLRARARTPQTTPVPAAPTAQQPGMVWAQALPQAAAPPVPTVLNSTTTLGQPGAADHLATEVRPDGTQVNYYGNVVRDQYGNLANVPVGAFGRALMEGTPVPGGGGKIGTQGGYAFGQALQQAAGINPANWKPADYLRGTPSEQAQATALASYGGYDDSDSAAAIQANIPTSRSVGHSASYGATPRPKATGSAFGLSV